MFNIIIIFIVFVYIPIKTNSRFVENDQSVCPYMYPKPFFGYAPRDNTSAGYFKPFNEYQTLHKCTLKCCTKLGCNIVFMHNQTCYHVHCKTDSGCLPLSQPTLDMKSAMVLVKPVQNEKTWSDYLDAELSIDRLSVTPDELIDHYDSFDGGDSQYLNDGMIADESSYTPAGGGIENKKIRQECTTSMNCGDNEECVSLESSIKICQCITGYYRNQSGQCQRDTPVVVTPKQISTTKKPLIVSALSKNIRLPESETTLSAFTVPNGQYSYEWKLLKRPDNSEGTMMDQNGATIQLTHVTEGLYTFRVDVLNADSFGETFVNLTVEPPLRLNKPPTVVITPKSQIVRLPTTGAVLDGSGSYDDDGIKSWHWELHRGPLGYSPILPEISTLQLKDLTTPGNYTFKLTVTDTDGVQNSTTANITVMKVIDYPPVANAGPHVIIYLPNNELTLNGNLSTDDHAIESWEWTKSANDANKAVDMQDTRTPYLKLSHLEEGYYTFELRVTDSAGQSNSAEVHVFVKQSSHKPPVAHAGNNQTITLPQNWAVLEGNATSESGHVVSYHWEKLSGPSQLHINNPNASCTNVTQLTRGQYIFRLTVVDDSGNAVTDLVIINVTQVKNDRPKANAGGDHIIELPQSLVTLNGSTSHDDVGIAQWQWSREDISLASGDILGDSDKQPVLMLTNLVPGRYVFRLKVADEDGVSDEDTASLMVKPDPQLINVVELTLGAQARTLTQSQIKGVMQELGLLVRDDATLTIRSIRSEQPGGRAVVSIIAHSSSLTSPSSSTSTNSGDSVNSILSGLQLEHLLKDKLYRDSSLLRLSVASLRTAICQNNCSNHGVCDEHTRRCLCEAFWMQNLFEKYFGHGEANCEWSVLYVVIGLCSVGIFVSGFIWSIAFLCSRACQQRRRIASTQRPPKYALLDDDDEQNNYNGQKMMISETDTDSDVLFESRNNKSGGSSGRRELIGNGYNINTKTNRNNNNGFIKIGRRIKT